MSGEYDVFDRSKSSRVKCDSYVEPNVPRKSIKRNRKYENISLEDYEKNKGIFKDVIFDVFGISVNDERFSLNKDCSLFIILSGGKKREKQYFSHLLDYPSLFYNVKISFITGTDQIDELLYAAKKQKSKLVTFLENEYGGVNIELGDIIFILTDVDSFIGDIKKVLPTCKKENINLIISNPCFEIWLYYSHKDCKPLDYKCDNKEKVSKNFKTYIGEQLAESCGGLNPEEEIFNILQTMEISKSNYKESGGIPELFSTQMHFLMEKMYPIIKESLEKLKLFLEKQKMSKRKLKKKQ